MNKEEKLQETDTIERLFDENVDVSKAIRRLPYVENYYAPCSVPKPVFAGFHRTWGGKNDGKFHGAFTIRYPDGYYVMLPRKNAGGGVYITRDNIIIWVRIFISSKENFDQ